MKKHTKILLLLLSLVLVLTTFTVIALATDEGETELKPPVVSRTINFETYEDGGKVQNSSSKKGKWYAETADNGNKYALASWEVGTKVDEATGETVVNSSAAGDNWDLSSGKGYDHATTYNLQNYPTFALDFDVRSNTTSFYSSVTVRTDLYGGSSNNNRITQMGSVKISDMLAKPVANEWYHITVVVRYLDNGYFNFRYYVNGIETYNILDKTYDALATYLDADGNLTKNNIRVAYTSFYPPTANTTATVAWDNIQYTYYPDGWTDDAIATYVYNEKYEMPFGFTEAKIGDTVYDDPQKAIDAAKDGETVTLTKNATERLVVDKNISIDTQNNAYSFTYTTSKGYEATEANGIFSFAVSEKTVKITWDEACADDCDCYDYYGGHTLTATTDAIIGMVPEYFGALPTFPVTADYTQKIFLGWSYENDGTVDELKAVTEADIENGIKLYPVYTEYTYAIEYIPKAGKPTYHREHEFYDVVTAATANSTVKLVRDVYTDCPTIVLTKTITVDINGNDLIRTLYLGKVYEATKDADGNLVYGTTELRTVSASSNFFSCNADNIKFYLKSTAGGGDLYNTYMNCDSWEYEGEIVKRTSTGVGSGRLIYVTYSNKNKNFQAYIDGNGMSIYASSLWYQDSASAGDFVLEIDAINYYKVGNTSNRILEARSNKGYELHVSNSFFYANASNSLLLLGTDDNTHDAAKIANVTFTNCDFTKEDASYSYGVSTLRKYNSNVSFDGCRLFDVGDNNSGLAKLSDCLVITGRWDNQDLAEMDAAEGYVYADTAIKYSYVIPSKSTLSADTSELVNTIKPIVTTTRNVTYNKVVSKPVNVTWVDGDGNTTAAVAYPGATLTTPETEIIILENDNYRNMLWQWADAKEGGKAAPSILGFDPETKAIDTETSEYTFYAVTEIGGASKYVSSIKNAMFSLTYYGHLGYYIHVPVQEGIEIIHLGDYEPDKISVTTIDGVKYWTNNCGWIGPVNALKDDACTIEYKVDGVSYKKVIYLNALMYAEMLLADENTAEVEKKAMLSMMSYVEEAYKAVATNNVLSDENKAKFDGFFNTYNEGNRPNYISEYPENEILTVDEAAIDGLIDSINFEIYASNNRFSFVVTLSKEAVDLGYKLEFSNVGTAIKGVTNEDGSVKYYTNNTTLVGGLMASPYTISVVDKDGKVVTRDLDKNAETPEVAATINYSLATYCNKVDSKLAEALYTFGKDVKAVRSYLATK